MSEEGVNACAVCNKEEGGDVKPARLDARIVVIAVSSTHIQSPASIEIIFQARTVKPPTSLPTRAAANAKTTSFASTSARRYHQNPAVTRTLSCPADSTFEDFHEALQIAFGWASTHPHDLKIKDPAEEVRRLARVAEEENDNREESMRKVMQSIEATGSPTPQQRDLLRIIEADPHGPGGFMSGRGVDIVSCIINIASTSKRRRKRV